MGTLLVRACPLSDCDRMVLQGSEERFQFLRTLCELRGLTSELQAVLASSWMATMSGMPCVIRAIRIHFLVSVPTGAMFPLR